MRLVIIESPYAEAPGRPDVRLNVQYARDCLADSLRRGEAPLASHLLYTQALNDQDPTERAQGIAAGLAWGAKAEATIVYTDFGISYGMECGIARAKAEGRKIEYRQIINKGTRANTPHPWKWS